MADILLDPAIKTHVLLPITLIMILVYILRQIVGIWMTPKPKFTKLSKIRQQQFLNKCVLESNNSWSCLTESEWNSHKTFITENFTKKSNLNKILDEPIDEKDDSNDNDKKQKQEFKNPFTANGLNESMMDTMKSNLLNYLPQPILMFYMSNFFKGYIALKLPFELTNNFKQMFQSSIMTPDLNVSYVTGISWYFVNLLGIESIGKIILEKIGIFNSFQNIDDIILENFHKNLNSGNGLLSQQNVQQQQQLQMQMSDQQKTEAVFKKHADNIRMVKYKSCLEGTESRFIELFSKKTDTPQPV